LVPVSADFPAKIYSIDIAIHYEKDLWFVVMRA
jgi:hypothetical protein